MNKINIIILVGLLIFTFSCKEPDNAIYSILNDTEYGAALRTKERISNDFNIFDLSSKWEVIIEEQDEEYGNLLNNVNVFVGFIDNFDDGVDNNKEEVLVKTIQSSDFSTSSNGLPETTLSVVFQEAIDALNLAVGEYNGGDSFPIRLELVLTDGRKFSAASSSSTLQQSYWNSPFAYKANILCVPDSPITGDYLLNMQDSYGDGWNGASVRVTIDGVATDYTIDDGSSNNATITVPIGATSLTWEFVSGAWDSEVTFQITGPNSGNIIGDYGPSPAAGVFSLNLCNE